ncbi:hypothetical protein ACU686_32485 [Yinghuangia aomiensis]
MNRRMCALAGEVADGFVTHPTNSSPRYLEEVLPARAGRGRGQREGGDGTLELVAGTQVIAGATQDALDKERERQRRLFAFLYSTSRVPADPGAVRLGRDAGPACPDGAAGPVGRPARRGDRRRPGRAGCRWRCTRTFPS